MGTSITFKRPDGKEAQGYLANAARGNAPGVVVIQEWWGLSEQIKGLCDRFAIAGFDALAPDLYKGKVVPYHDTDAAGKEMNSLDFIDATTQTVRGAVQYLSRNGAKVGLTGFCLGGAVTIIGAAKVPEGVTIPEGSYYNRYFPGHAIKMPKPLSDGQVTFDDGSPATVAQYAHDVTTFLMWSAEPHMEARKRIGLQVFVFLILLTGLLYFTKKKVWADAH